MRLKQYKKRINIITYNLIILAISLISSIFLINYFAKKSKVVLMPYAKSKIQEIVSNIINHSTENIKYSNNLYSLDTKADEIKMINYNTREVIKLLDDITFNIEDKLKKNTMYGEIPFGIIFNNSMLSNLGPKIKLKFLFINSIISKVETEIKPYGINNAYIEMRVNISVNGRIILPFVSEEVIINNVIPISINIVSGKVPDAYISSFK